MEVELISYTPEPDRVCGKAARVCVSNTPNLDDMFSDTDFNRSLEIAMRSGHTSVAEHAVFSFHVRGISRACSHQLVRHRLASYAQQSQRYVRMDKLDMVIPKSIEDAIECELMNGGGWDPSGCLQDTLKNWRFWMDESIKKMRQLKVPEEDIRYIFPNACKTNIIVTMNGRELLNFFTLRCCNKAQWEIRELAIEMLKLVKPIAPILFEDAGPNCMHDCGCQELRPCNQDVPFGAHTIVNGETRDDRMEI